MRAQDVSTLNDNNDKNNENKNIIKNLIINDDNDKNNENNDIIKNLFINVCSRCEHT